MNRQVKSIRRILVALDASPSSLNALQAAARLASMLEAELEGLFVEDEMLLRSVDLPFTRLVGSFSGLLQPVGRKEVEQQLRTRADKVRHAMELVAERGRLRWSFRVVRGSVASEVLSAAAQTDLISLGRSGWSHHGTRAIGQTTQMVLERAPTPVLLLDHEAYPGQAVVVVYDGTETAGQGLKLGYQLVQNEGPPLIIGLLESPGETKKRAQTELDRLSPKSPVHYLELGEQPLETLKSVVRRQGIGVLILPTAIVNQDRIPGLLSGLRCPVLVVA